MSNDQPQSESLRALLLWEGRLNNARLRELLGVGVTRTSQLIRAFRESHPTWLEWDSVKRGFTATPEAYRSNFDAVASLAQYLSIVGIPHTAAGSPDGQTLWSAFPDWSVPLPRVFAQLSQAIDSSSQVEITYRSMSNPLPHTRQISPHSLVRAGRRWHVRGFCTSRADFRDFALGRIGRVKILTTPCEKNAEEDLAWITTVDVRLVAHPALSSEQQDVVRAEYFANTAARVERCRAALVMYFIQDLRAATDVIGQVPPEYQLAVENIEELRQWTFAH